MGEEERIEQVNKDLADDQKTARILTPNEVQELMKSHKNKVIKE